MKLAKEALFGDSVLLKCTPAGTRELPGLPLAELFMLKTEIFELFLSIETVQSNLNHWGSAVQMPYSMQTVAFKRPLTCIYPFFSSYNCSLILSCFISVYLQAIVILLY